ncbi:hypothetical protein [Streptomyces sp. NPDC050264]|uniref:hypothetical protein n=1 Tax=Streptomyces sp. NPDC050264 TaxID=3155038 RepID=UPI0034327591
MGGSPARMPLHVGAIGTAVLAAVAASAGGAVLDGLHHAFLTAGLVTAAALPVTAAFPRRR